MDLTSLLIDRFGLDAKIDFVKPVPPLLAQGIARVVWTLLKKNGLAG